MNKIRWQGQKSTFVNFRTKPWWMAIGVPPKPGGEVPEMVGASGMLSVEVRVRLM